MQQWPKLSYANSMETYATLHMWTQIVGKIKLAALPWMNHSWHVTLHTTPTGFSTMSIPYEHQNFQIDFDFVSHQLKVVTSEGKAQMFDLTEFSVADFYQKIFRALRTLGINLRIRPVPVEIEDAIPFEQDTRHASYDRRSVSDLHQAFLSTHNVLTKFRCGFKGKCSPVHFFWGSFDLAVSRFSGRSAPKHPGGIPNLPDRVAEEAYSHEVSSCGFWPGSNALPEATFYSYIYPEPKGYADSAVDPKEAYYHKTLREFVLPYHVVQRAADPEKALLTFLGSTFESGTRLAGWV